MTTPSTSHHPGRRAGFGNVIRYLPTGEHVMFLGWRDPGGYLGTVWYGLRLQHKVGGKYVTQNAASENWLTVDR